MPFLWPMPSRDIPIPSLLEALRQAEERLRAAEAAVPPQPGWFERCWGGRFGEALEAWQQRPDVRAVAEIRNVIADAMRAVTADRLAQLVSGELRAWGREDKTWGTWRAIPPDAWNTLVVIDEKGGIVRGPKSAAARLYGVVVAPTQREEMAVVQQSSEADEAAGAEGRRRRNSHDDASSRLKVVTVVATARRLWPDKRARPPVTQMVTELVRLRKAEGYSGDTLRKILSGTYAPAKQLGISLDW
jgi:hypothetical protein